MKKNIKYLVILFGLSMMLFSCVKDKGNYTYTDLPDFFIDTVGQVTTFQAYQGQGTVAINPKVVYGGNEADLRYVYLIYSGSTVPDTLAQVKNLSTTINKAPGTYTVELNAIEKPTGIKAFMRYTVIVQPPVPPGMMVMYEKNGSAGNSEIDLISSPLFITATPAAVDSQFTALYGRFNNGEVLAGVPVASGNSLYTSFANGNTNNVYALTDKTIVSVQRTDFTKLQNTDQLFLGNPPAVRKFEAITPVLAAGLGAVYNDGDVWWSQDGVLIGKYSAPGDYKAAPFAIFSVGNAVSFFDKLNGRFIRGIQFSSAAEPFAAASAGRKFSLSNIQKELLFIDRAAGLSGTDPYKFSIWKDFGNQNRTIYIIDFSKPATPDVNVINFTAAPDIQNAFLYACGNVNSTAFYATPSKVYYFTYSQSADSYTTPVAGFTAPAGEVITAMRLNKQLTAQAIPTGTTESRQLFVATWNSSTQKGKVYYFNVDATSGAMSAPAKTWDINGKVGSFYYKPG